MTPESSFDLGASAGFSDERIGLLSPSEGDIELTGRESLGTVVSLRVSAGTTPSPALKTVMQSIARQSGLAKKSNTAKSAAPARSAAGATQAQVAASPNSKNAGQAGSGSALSTNLEREKLLARAALVPDAERGVLSVNLAASKFSPPPNSPDTAQEHDARRPTPRRPSAQDRRTETALSPASFYRSATGHDPYKSSDEVAANNNIDVGISPSNSSKSSPASSPGAPSPTAEERKLAAARDRSLVDHLVRPIAQPISQEWTKSPAPTAW